MNFYKSSILVAALAMGFGFTSCDDDDDLVFSGKPVANAEMRAFLEGKGYQFNDAGNLLMDAKVAETDSLDLSGTKMTDLKDLVLFPNLKALNLSNNGYGETFDFATVPAQITSLNLSGNEIYEYANLVKVDVAENGEETVTTLRNFDKLYLPEEAKDNMSDIVYFYRSNKDAITGGTLDMRMEDANGKLAAYTTLRNVPDAELRKFMQENFSDVFEGEQIDITKRLGALQNTTAFTIGNKNSFAVKKPTSLEGVQYILNSPYYKATMFVVRPENTLDLPRIKFPETVSTITLQNLNVQEEMAINCGTIVTLNQMNGLKKIDFSQSKIFGQRGAESEGQNMFGSYLQTYDCPDLEEIKFPEVKDLKANKIDVECMPKLKELSMKNFNMIVNIQIGDLNDDCKLEYPNLTEFYYDALWEMAMPTTFSVSEKTYKRQETKDFVDKFYTNATENPLSLMSRLSCDKNDPYYWEF